MSIHGTAIPHPKNVTKATRDGLQSGVRRTAAPLAAGLAACVASALLVAGPAPDAEAASTARPAAANTGVPSSAKLRTLTTANRPYKKDGFTANGTVYVIRTANASYDRWRFNAFVEVRAPGVRLTKSHFRGARTSVDRALLTVVPGTTTTGKPSASVTDSTLSPRYPSYRVNGIMGSNFTARRVEITGTVDGIHIHGTGSRTDARAGNVTVDRSWIHGLRHFANDGGAHRDGTHNDAIQVVGGRRITITGNSLTGATNAAIMVKPDRNVIGSVTITGNWAGGGACTFNVAKGRQGAMSAIRVASNRLDRTSRFRCGMILARGSGVSATSNVWTGTRTAASIVWK